MFSSYVIVNILAPLVVLMSLTTWHFAGRFGPDTVTASIVLGIFVLLYGKRFE